jgi:flagellar protein FliO/FliZ
MLELTLRLVFSLAVVVGLMLVLARVASRRFSGQSGAVVRVVHRQALSRSASVSVVSVGSRLLVLGTTDQQVRVLAELEPDELDAGEVLTLPALVAGDDDEVADLAGLADAPDAPASGTAPVRRRGPGAHRADAPAPARPTRTARPAATDGPLAGSVLSPQTWRQALAAATRRAS